MKKYLKFLIIAICFILIYKVIGYSTYGAPSEFGNESTTTCSVGGDLGIVNCTGNISTTAGVFVGDGTGLTGLSTLVGNCSGDGVCSAILYYSGLSALDFYNGTEVNDSITKHNASMKVYVDAQDVIYNASMVTHVDNNYYNQTEIDNMDLYNGSQVNDSITKHNASMKVYVDAQDTAQDACNEITNCVDNAWDADGDISPDEISESKINFVTACATGDFYRLTGNDLECTTPTDTNNCSIANSCANIIYETELDDEAELEAQLGDVSNVFTNNDGTLGNTTLEIEGVCWTNVTKSEWVIPEYILDVDDEDVETDLNTYVDIGGDIMTGDFSVNQKFNVSASNGNVRMSGNLSIGPALIYYNGSHLIFT